MPNHRVIKIGFSGARNLYKDLDLQSEEIDNDELVLQTIFDLIQPKGQIMNDLELDKDYHFFSGISQMAIGGDFLFSEVCKELNIPQQIVLPTFRSAFLNGKGNKETSVPDFSSAQQERATQLLESHHIVSERTVAKSSDRHERFEEVNLHIAREADVIIGIIRKGQMHGTGGTSQLLKSASNMGKLTYEITLLNKEGKLGIDVKSPKKELITIFKNENFAALPDEFDTTELKWNNHFPNLPTVSSYTAMLKDFASAMAGSAKSEFKTRAKRILRAHVLATILAALGLIAYYAWSFDNSITVYWLVFSFVLLELLALLTGFITHRRLHKMHNSDKWSWHRSLAEICRSVRHVTNCTSVELNYLFLLRFEKELYPVLRTMQLLNHIRLKEKKEFSSLEKMKEEYTKEETSDSPRGQAKWFNEKIEDYRAEHHRHHLIFDVLTVIAIAAVSFELVDVLPKLMQYKSFDPVQGWNWFLSFLAIIMPVSAVAVLSWINIVDAQDQADTYENTKSSFELIVKRIDNAETVLEFNALVEETELIRLSEVSNWKARTKKKGVS